MKTPHELLQTPKLYDEEILAGVSCFLPMLYVAWSDSILTETEIDAIREQLDRKDWKWLSDTERQWIDQWLDPNAPPSSIDLKNWLVIINRMVAQLKVKQKLSLAELGKAIAEIGAAGREKAAAKEEIFQALSEVEQALGVMGTEATEQFIEQSEVVEAETPAIDIAKITKWLDGDYQEIINRVKTVISSEEFKLGNFEFPTKKEHRRQVIAWCKALAKEGFGKMGYPTAYGGGGDVGGYFAIMEALSYHDLSLVIKFGVQFGLWGMSVHLLGTEKHHKAWLNQIGDLVIPGCFAMTETGHGSNVQGLETTATYDRETKEFVIHTPHEGAGKEYIGNAARDGVMATVFAKLIVDDVDFGVAAFAVPIRTPAGYALQEVKIADCGEKLGLNGVDNGRIWFNQQRIPQNYMLDRFASIDEDGYFTSKIPSDGKRFFTMLGTLVGGRVGIPRSGLSAAKKGLAIAIKYGAKRRQFGPTGKPEIPILDYQTHQRKLMPLLANAYAYHFALNYLTDRFLTRSEEDAREVEALAAGLKASSTWNTTQTLQICREACGGKGYLVENMLADLKADTDIYTTFEGDNTVLMQLVAKSLLTDFRQEFHNTSFFTVLRFISKRAELNLFDKNPIIIRNTDREHLLDPEFHLTILNHRESDQLISVAQRLQKYMKEMDAFKAFNQCQQHLVNLAQAHVDRVVVEKFQAALAGFEEGAEKQVMTEVYQLFAISLIDRHKGWYLENEYMTGTKTKAIRKLLSELCGVVRLHAVALVDAFAIPEACLPELVVEK